VRPAGSGPKARKQKPAENPAPRKGRSRKCTTPTNNLIAGRTERPGTARPGRARRASAQLEMAIRAQSRLDVN